VIRLGYHGWSSFRIEPDGFPSIVLDPCLSQLLPARVASWEEIEGASLIAVSHGHHEHLRDTARIARRMPVPVVAPPQVAQFLIDRRGLPASQVLVARPDEPVRVGPLTLVGRSFPHLPKHAPSGKVSILARQHALGSISLLAANLPAVLRAAWAIADQPDGPPYFAWDLRWDGGPRVFVTIEAFTHLLPHDELRRWLDGPPIDLAVVGVESRQEDAARSLTEMLSAKSVCAAAVHETFERFYGYPPVEPARFTADRPSWRFLTPGVDLQLQPASIDRANPPEIMSRPLSSPLTSAPGAD
jgi:L-ascorbate metabolism protein UlaG (beta-lactamase superfamily)